MKLAESNPPAAEIIQLSSCTQNIRPLNFVKNSLNRHSRENGNPVPDQVEDKHFQLVIDSRFRGNDRKGAFCKALNICALHQYLWGKHRRTQTFEKE